MDALYYQVDLLKTLNDKLVESSNIYGGFIDMSGCAYFYYNYDNEHFMAAGDFMGIFGIEVRDITDTELLPEYAEENDYQKMSDILNIDNSSEKQLTGNFRLKKSRRWIEGVSRVRRSEFGSVTEKFVSFRDMTKFHMQNDELTYLAYYDSLTGLVNRNCFIKRLSDTVERAESEHTSVSVVILDIDSFKQINDSIGLVLGDELIQDVGQYLMSFNNEHVLAGRFGTDVFVLSIYDPCGENTVENIFNTIRMRLRRPFILSNGDELLISMTAGVAAYPDAGDSGFAVLQNAEVCVYAAKNSGRGSIKYFDSDMLDRFLNEYSMEKRLQDAIQTKSFVLFFQPQYNVRNGMLRGCEALIRWIDGDGRVISPAEFIPLAEKSGGIIPIGNWVIRQALLSFLEWRDKYGFDGIVSINISAVQMKKDNFASNLLNTIRSMNIDPGNVEIEITESVFIDDYNEIIAKMNSLRSCGIRVALDDFGTGFSSLSYLKELPIDTLKIDKSFIDTVISDMSTGIITESVVHMVRKLGLETIAEGVENDEQMSFLKKIDCDNIQGYLLGKPMSCENFEKLITKDMTG